ncbi:hypothetical protein HN011_005917 [Eciton burchellii]|nr:hypothetical protein HN011_005917 [Eciton burchellii]
MVRLGDFKIGSTGNTMLDRRRGFRTEKSMLCPLFARSFEPSNIPLRIIMIWISSIRTLTASSAGMNVPKKLPEDDTPRRVCTYFSE